MIYHLTTSVICGLICFVTFTHAKNVTYDFKIGWVTANPDGAKARPVIGINGQWPIPHITADVGDRVIVNVMNDLGNQSTSLHFHGLYQNGTTDMDGPAGVTQCPIAPGLTFKYDFEIKQPGTYWYHSHSPGQYPDGLRGALIVNDPDSPYKGQYDEELVLTLSDWYHDQMPGLLKWFLSYANPTGAEPVPDSALMNDTQNLKILIQPGKTYMFRVVNMAAFAAQYLWLEGHTMRIIEVDGIYTEPAEAEQIYLTAAQRYSFLVTTKNDTSANFPIVGSMDQDLFDTVPPGLNPNVTGWLVYDEAKPLPDPTPIDEFDPFDDFTLVPQDGEKLFENPDYSAFFNDITYVQPKIPTLYTALTTGATATNAAVYGTNVHAYILEKNQVIEIILNNDDPGKHPFHLHGHAFQTVIRSDEEAGFYTNNETFPEVPMRRDTVMVRPNGHMVLRFRADNPDMSDLLLLSRVWLFHCHIEWHVASGLTATMIEAPEELQANLKIPEDHLQVCKSQNIATAGNAAGRTDDLLNLNGATLPPARLPDGFTARGIVALVFSILAAFIGLAVISWYASLYPSLIFVCLRREIIGMLVGAE
ncbi:hypothetical protein MMC31_005668 [Peltigera leucophlebia]|nr:hypothetical protein [Peltigera leucophlebia]